MPKGCIYLFRQTGTNYVKIGMTECETVDARFQAFKTYSPFGGEILGIINTDAPRKLEKQLHQLYASKRLAGEFFNLQQNEIDFILDSFSSIRQKELRSFFELWIADGNNDVAKLKSFLEKDIRANRNDSHLVEKAIVEICQKHFNNSEVTATQILKYINNNTDIQTHISEVGSILKKYFKRYSKRSDTGIRKVYKIEKVVTD